MFVQLVGLPGAGKTTIAMRLAQLYPERFASLAIDHETLPRLLWSRPIATLATLVTLTPIFSHAILAVRAPLGLRERLVPAFSLLKSLLALQRLRREGTDSEKIWLVDGFVYQLALSSLGYSTKAPPRRLLKGFLRILRSDFVLPIFIATEAREAMERARTRPEGFPERLAALDQATVQTIYARQAALLQELRALTPRALWVENQGDAMQCVDEIRMQIGKHLRTADTRPTVAHFVFNLTTYSGAAQQALSLCRHLRDYDGVLFNVERSRTKLEIAPVSDGVRVIHLPRNPIKSAFFIACFGSCHRH